MFLELKVSDDSAGNTATVTHLKRQRQRQRRCQKCCTHIPFTEHPLPPPLNGVLVRFVGFYEPISWDFNFYGQLRNMTLCNPVQLVMEFPSKCRFLPPSPPSLVSLMFALSVAACMRWLFRRELRFWSASAKLHNKGTKDGAAMRAEVFILISQVFVAILNSPTSKVN